jgi:hypothetical protein
MYKLLRLGISGNGLIDSDCGEHDNITFKSTFLGTSMYHIFVFRLVNVWSEIVSVCLPTSFVCFRSYSRDLIQSGILSFKLNVTEWI